MVQPASFYDLSWWRRIVLVAISLTGSSLLTLALQPILHDEARILPFTLAVIISSAYGGWIAGVAATLLSFVIADFFFMEALYILLSQPSDYALLVVFLMFGVSLSILNQALAKANKVVRERSDQLARSNEELQRFAYSVSHDLQEPLRSIRMFAELFLARHRDRLDDESRLWMNFILQGADRMKQLIVAILDLSTSGRNPELTRVEVGEIVNSVLQDLRTTIEQSGAEVHLAALPGLFADEKQLRRVFLNLIGNAIKHNADGKPVITISAESRSDAWALSVRDNGPGINPEDRERIFETFQRASGQAPGHGLGLATCKRIIEQHGGKIWVESVPGYGADFRFTLPKSRD